MNLLKRFFLFAAIFCCGYCQAQELDSIKVDTSSYPCPTYIRVKFPHNGFQFTGSTQVYPTSYPPLVFVGLSFKECTGDTGITYFDTTTIVYVDSITRVLFLLYLDTNTIDSNCVLRTVPLLTDSAYMDFGSASQSVKDVGNSVCAIYPIPVTNHRLTIETCNLGSKPATATFYNLQGGFVASYPLQGAKEEIALPEYAISGNYLLMIRMENGEVLRKIITVQ